MTAENGGVPLDIATFGARKEAIDVAKRFPTLPAGAVGYFGEINSPNCPYICRVNEPRTSQLFNREFGYSQAQLDKVKIYVIGEHLPGRGYKFTSEQKKFFFDPDIYGHSYAGAKEDENGTQHVVFYVFEAWKDVNRDKSLILSQSRRALRRTKGPKNIERSWEVLNDKLKLFKVTPRFRRYLEKAPIERVETSLSRIIPIKVRNLLRNSEVHEVSHAFEYGNSFERAVKKLKNNNRLIQWFLDEIAELEERRVAKKTKWYDLVEFEVVVGKKPAPEKIIFEAAKNEEVAA